VAVAAPPRPEARRLTPLLLAGLGALGLAIAAPFGPEGIAFGVLFFVLAIALAARDVTVPVLTWTHALAAYFLLVWLLPIKLYRLPVTLPFNLEPYRLVLLVLVLAWLASLLAGWGRMTSAGHGRPLLLLAGVSLGSLILNYDTLAPGGLDSEAIKPISYFLSFLLAFVLVASVVGSLREIDRLLRALVIGGSLVALAAIWQSRQGYNVFDHLDSWIPALVKQERDVEMVRGGNIRVYASAQHAIELGVELLMMFPLALYLSSRAASEWRRRAWLVLAIILVVGALATVSRTTVIMLVTMTLVAILLKGRTVTRFWPLLLVLPFVVHYVAPGTLGGIYKAFFPEEGLVADLNVRAGEGGSGRLADIDPGLRLWGEKPVLGHGLGSQFATGEDPGAPAGLVPSSTVGLIFDDQYLNTLVSLGILGLVATVWLVWGSAIKLGRSARRLGGPASDLFAAASVACAGYAASMVLFDSFAFVQCTLVFFLVASLALRARELAMRETPTLARPGSVRFPGIG
jgi:polysaccharide biosynthesis protein PslJ